MLCFGQQPPHSDGARERAAPGFSASDSKVKVPINADKIYPAFVDALPSLDGKCVAITGTTSGTGYWAALAAVKKKASAVLLLNRQSERSKVADADVVAAAPAGTVVHSVACDLSSFESVRTAIPVIEERASAFGGLDVICLNAGIAQMPDDRTVDGYDVQMQVNHLSHAILADKLMPCLEKAAAARGEARIVFHTSGARHWASKSPNPFGGKNFTKCPPNTLGGNSGSFMVVNLMSQQMDRYHHSKRANSAYTMALRDDLKAKGSKVKVVCADPGGATTSLSANGFMVDSNTPVNVSATNMLMWMFAGVMQSGGDGTCPLLACCFNPETTSGDLWAPEESSWMMPGLYMKGKPRRVVVGGVQASQAANEATIYSEELSVSEANKKAAWDATRAAIDAF